MPRNTSAAALLLTAGVAAITIVSSIQAPLSAAPAPAGAPGVLLKYKYTPGEVLRYRMTQSTQTATNMGGRSMPSTTRLSETMTQTVKSVDPRTGNATIVVDAGTPQMTMMMNGKSMPMNLGSMHMPPTTMVLSPAGKPISMGMGGGAMSALGSSMQGMMGGGGGGGMGQYSAFPSHPVRVGDIWRSTFGMGSMGIQMLMKQSLVGLKPVGGHSMATIASRLTMNMNMAPKMAGMKITGVATGTGHEQFDVTTGTLEGMTQNMVMNSSTKMPASMSHMQGMSGAVNMHMVMTMQMQRIGG